MSYLRELQFRTILGSWINHGIKPNRGFAVMYLIGDYQTGDTMLNDPEFSTRCKNLIEELVPWICRGSREAFESWHDHRGLSGAPESVKVAVHLLGHEK